MKFGNVLLIIITSIFTFLGLLFSKLYEKYVKKNILVQGMLYMFWTLFALRALLWAAKPLIPTSMPRCLQNMDFSNIVVPEITPLVAIIIFFIGIIGVCVFFKHTINLLRK